MLMLLSGLMLGRSIQEGPGRDHKGKLDRVARPLPLWTVTTHAIMRRSALSPNVQPTDPRTVLGPCHLWFIVLLALFHALAPVLERFNALGVVLWPAWRPRGTRRTAASTASGRSA